MRNFILNNKYIIALVTIVLLCLWQLSFFVYISKWDNIDAYLPYRYFVSDYLWNGEFPFWNSFQNLGTPVYSDLQSGTWYPITWIIMLFGKYTIGSLTVEILSCYIIAAVGFYKLGNFIYGNPKVSFIVALCYALSGFMVGSSQLLPFLIGIAWLPWIIFAGLSFFKTLKYRYAILTALFLAICTSGASPPFVIILLYVFVAMFIYFLWKNKTEKKNIITIVAGGGVILVVSVLLLLPYINSFYEFLPYFNRSERLPYERLTYNNFTVYEYISFLFPFSILSETELFSHTDVTLRNGYFGILGVIYLVISFFSVKNKYFVPLIIVAILSLLFAAGSSTFFYKIAYELPGFGLFKHSSFFKIYFIFSSLLLAGFSIKKELRGDLSKKMGDNTVKIIFGTIFLITAVSFVNMPKEELSQILQKLIASDEKFEGTLSSHLFINGIILLVLVSLFFFLKKKRNLFIGLVVVVVLDVFIQVQLSAPKTVYNKIEYSEVSSFFNELPNDINQEASIIPLKNLDEKLPLKKIDGFWRNLSILNKTISNKGYNPMRFKSFEKGKENGALDQTIENPVLFFQEPEEGVAINSTLIGYNKFKAGVVNNAPQVKKFLLNQNYHGQWKAYYNEKPLAIMKENELIMGVEIPAKSSGEIQFVYESPRTTYAMIISGLTYLMIIIYFFKVTFFAKRISSK